MGLRWVMVVLVMGAILAVSPGQAFVAKELRVSLDVQGNAEIQFDYSLSFLENVAIFLKIADPGRELKSALEANLNKNVEIERIGNSQARFRVEQFATLREEDGKTIMKTPGLSFASAEQALKSYWFAPLVKPDFSPDLTIVTFPDGYQEVFYGSSGIPPLSRELP
jgi:preprotein translocase subunit SecF